MPKLTSIEDFFTGLNDTIAAIRKNGWRSVFPAVFAMIAMIATGIAFTVGFYHLMIFWHVPSILAITLTAIVTICFHLVDILFNLAFVKDYTLNTSGPTDTSKKKPKAFAWVLTLVVAAAVGFSAFIDTYEPAKALLASLLGPGLTPPIVTLLMVAAIAGGILNFLLTFKPEQMEIPDLTARNIMVLIGSCLMGGFAFYMTHVVALNVLWFSILSAGTATLGTWIIFQYAIKKILEDTIDEWANTEATSKNHLQQEPCPFKEAAVLLACLLNAIMNGLLSASGAMALVPSWPIAILIFICACVLSFIIMKEDNKGMVNGQWWENLCLRIKSNENAAVVTLASIAIIALFCVTFAGLVAPSIGLTLIAMVFVMTGLYDQYNDISATQLDRTDSRPAASSQMVKQSTTMVTGPCNKDGETTSNNGHRSMQQGW